MTTIALRLPDNLGAGLDSLVRSGDYRTRTGVMKTALSALVDAHEGRKIDRSIVAGYTQMPQTDEEIAPATAMTRALIEDEPW